MNTELDKKLCETYPKIFVNRNKPMTETCMCWGFECGDGWYNLLEALCEALTYTYTSGIRIGTEYFDLPAPQAIVDQVKEKFGTLRFYYRLDYGTEYMELCEKYPKDPDLERWANEYRSYFDGIVHYAEILSGRTCEVTGKPGEMHVSGGTRYGWYRTLNREWAKTDPAAIGRNYVPVADLPPEPEPKV